MWKKLIATVLALSLPTGASAGQLRAAVEKAARDLATAQHEETRSRARLWTGVSLVTGGIVLASLGGVEVGEDEGATDVPEPGDDPEDSDAAEDSDAGGKAMLAGGIAAAGLGAFLLLTGRKTPGPLVSVRPGGVAIRHTIRF